MKTLYQFVTLLLALTSLTACGMLQMPTKMDDMKNQTHTDMKGMADQTHKDMGNMSDQTVDGLRLNKIGVALQNITLDANTEYFSPVPVDMMPWAQILADNLREDEFVKLMDMWARRITQIATSCSDLPGGVCTPELVARADHEKLAKFWAIASVAGLMSQAMIENTVNTEYTEGGQFNETVYQILAARQIFISSVLMDSTLMAKDFDNPGKFAKGVEYALDLQYIADLPFASKIDFNLMQMLDKKDQNDIAFDPTIASTEWANISSAFKTELTPQYKNAMQTPNNEDGAKLLALQAIVNAHLATKK